MICNVFVFVLLFFSFFPLFANHTHTHIPSCMCVLVHVYARVLCSPTPTPTVIGATELTVYCFRVVRLPLLGFYVVSNFVCSNGKSYWHWYASVYCWLFFFLCWFEFADEYSRHRKRETEVSSYDERQFNFSLSPIFYSVRKTYNSIKFKFNAFSALAIQVDFFSLCLSHNKVRNGGNAKAKFLSS